MGDLPAPSPTRQELLTQQFYDWESRGRGWVVWNSVVELEPPFRPFLGHFLPAHSVQDDGLVPTGLSRIARMLFGGSGAAAPPNLSEESAEIEEPEPEPLERLGELVEWQVALPKDSQPSREVFEQCLTSLSYCRAPLVFEVVGDLNGLVAQIVAEASDAQRVFAQLKAHFPEAVINRVPQYLEGLWTNCRSGANWILEFGLEREFMLPLNPARRMATDPLVGICAALEHLGEGEVGVFQVLFEPARYRWEESIWRAVTRADGKPFFENAPEMVAQTEQKLARPLVAAVVRVAVRSPEDNRVREIILGLGGALRLFANPAGNELMPLDNEGYPDDDHEHDLLGRRSRRSGMLLNSEELVSLVHLPTAAVRSRKLKRDIMRTKSPPEVVLGAGLVLGENEHEGRTTKISLTADQRVQHTHIIGASGTGKSTLLFNLIRQDIENGDGVAVLDPHGDLIDRILGIIPASRIEDVILVDPSDTDYPIGFNILSAHSEQEKSLLASDLVSVFRRLASSWGDQMDTVLQNSILAFLESSRGGTMADLRRFLIEPAFRADFLRTVSDPELIYYWRNVFPQLTGNRSVGPVLTRLQGFMSQKPIRNMVSQPENKLDFARIMDTRQIFLARLPEGLFGAENSYMLGALLVSKFQQIVMSRQAQEMSARRDFWLYIDEFDHFITPTMAEILKGARKYRLGLTLAHQELHQLQKEARVASAVATHPLTRIVFRVGDDDAKKLADGFTSFDAQSLKTLGKFQAIARVERSDFDFNLAIRLPPKEDADQTAQRRQEIITVSRRKYATPRKDVEAELLAKLPTEQREPEKSQSVPGQRQPQEARPVKTEPSPAEKPESEAMSSEDKRQHEAIKSDIQGEAESLDYSVQLEERLPLGQGQPDLILTRGDRRIACEVSETTHVGEEVDHIQLRLKAGFGHVAVISRSRKKLTRIQETWLESALDAQIPKVGFYSPEEFISKLYEWAADDPAGGIAERSKRSKQKIDLGGGPLSEPERRQREKEWLEQIRRRMKG